MAGHRLADAVPDSKGTCLGIVRSLSVFPCCWAHQRCAHSAPVSGVQIAENKLQHIVGHGVETERAAVTWPWRTMLAAC